MAEIAAVRRVLDPISDYRSLAAMRIRADLQYRVSFLLFLAASLIINLFDFLGIAVLFSNTETLGDWTLSEVAFLYGSAGVCFGLADLIVGQIDLLPAKIKDGSFDVVLTRPVNALVNLAASEFTLRRFGKISQAATVLVVSLVVNDIEWTPGRLLALVMMVISGTVIAMAAWVTTSSIAFWFVNTREAANAFTYGGNLAIAYPLHLFDQWLRVLLTYVIPLVFVSYVPALYILDLDTPLNLPDELRWGGPVAAIMMVVVARLVWRAGLRRYSSTGS